MSSHHLGSPTTISLQAANKCFMAEQAARLRFIKSEIIKEENRERDGRGGWVGGWAVGVEGRRYGKWHRHSQTGPPYLLFLGQRVPPRSSPPFLSLCNGDTGNENLADRILRSGGLGISCLIQTRTRAHAHTQAQAHTHTLRYAHIQVHAYLVQTHLPIVVLFNLYTADYLARYINGFARVIQLV